MEKTRLLLFAGEDTEAIDVAEELVDAAAEYRWVVVVDTTALVIGTAQPYQGQGQGRATRRSLEQALEVLNLDADNLHVAASCYALSLLSTAADELAQARRHSRTAARLCRPLQIGVEELQWTLSMTRLLTHHRTLIADNLSQTARVWEQYGVLMLLCSVWGDLVIASRAAGDDAGLKRALRQTLHYAEAACLSDTVDERLELAWSQMACPDYLRVAYLASAAWDEIRRVRWLDQTFRCRLALCIACCGQQDWIGATNHLKACNVAWGTEVDLGSS